MLSRTSSSSVTSRCCGSFVRWCVAVYLVAVCSCDTTVNTYPSTTLQDQMTVAAAAVSATEAITTDSSENDGGGGDVINSDMAESTTSTDVQQETGTVATVAAAGRGSHLHVSSSASTPSTSGTATTASAATQLTSTTASDAGAGSEEDDDRPLAKIAANISQNLLPLPAGAGAALVKPTKYHYYPHNQHIYLLPECAIQQVCNAVYVRLNWTQPLCACPSRYRDPCSASLNSDDLHTTELVTSSERAAAKRALTLVKTCEPTAEMRACRQPRDWSLLALQNVRTGKSHYLVICRCPEGSALEGPMSHDQPTYASVPGIRVYGMMCVQPDLIRRRGRPLRLPRETTRRARRLAAALRR